MESFECRGKWNIHHPDQTNIEGILKFNPINGGQLLLEFGSEQHDLINGQTRYEILDGQGDDGTSYTVIGCMYRGVNILLYQGNKKIIQHHYDVNIIIKDQKFHNVDKIRFSQFQVNFLHLPEWLGLFDSFNFNKQQINSKSIKFHGYTFRLVSDFTIENDTSIDAKKNIDIKKKTWILIEPHKPKYLEEVILIIEKIQKFLTFSTSHYNIPLTLKARAEKEKPDSDVQIYYKLGYWDSSYFTPSSNIMLLTHNDILESFGNLESFFRNWIKIVDELHHVVFDSYVINLINPHISEDVMFLNFVRGLESLHRIRFPEDRLSQEEYDRRMEYILSRIENKEYKRWFKGKLKRGYEWNLEQRLNKLTENDKLMRSKLFENDKTLHSLTTIIQGRRNYLAHLDQDNPYKKLDIKDLKIINSIMRKILEVLLLRDLKIQETIIEKIISRNLQTKPIFYSVEKHKEKIDEFLEHVHAIWPENELNDNQSKNSS
ncbi:MAG: HEPN domain-containing protein [Nitrososphaeraceae archaeon]